jgi:hypothetical protein
MSTIRSSSQRRIVVVTLMALASLVLAPAGASAAPPVNDDFDDAIEITDLPFSHTVDTSEATHAWDDPSHWWCSADEATVWYSFTPTDDVTIDVDTRGGDYYVATTVWTGNRGSLESVDCNWGRLRFDARAGTTYYVMLASAIGSDWRGTLELVVSAVVPPAPLDVGFTVDPVAAVNTASGVVTVTGTIGCSAAAGFDIQVNLHQRLGRFQARGDAWEYGPCGPGGTSHWSVTVRSNDTLIFGAGKANLELWGQASSWNDGDWWYENWTSFEQSLTIRLQPKR